MYVGENMDYGLKKETNAGGQREAFVSFLDQEGSNHDTDTHV
jgi:hypothetical protein